MAKSYSWQADQVFWLDSWASHLYQTVCIQVAKCSSKINELHCPVTRHYRLRELLINDEGKLWGTEISFWEQPLLSDSLTAETLPMLHRVTWDT